MPNKNRGTDNIYFRPTLSIKLHATTAPTIIDKEVVIKLNRKYRYMNPQKGKDNVISWTGCYPVSCTMILLFFNDVNPDNEYLQVNFTT